MRDSFFCLKLAEHELEVQQVLWDGRVDRAYLSMGTIKKETPDRKLG